MNKNPTFETIFSDSEVLRIAQCFIDREYTLRSCASAFGCSPTTVYNVFKYRLPDLSPELSFAVNQAISENKAARVRRMNIARQNKAFFRGLSL